MRIPYFKETIIAIDRPVTYILNSLSRDVDFFKNRLLIYTTHKAGSMFLHKLTYNLSIALGVNYYSINDDKFYDLIRANSWKTFIEDKKRYGCYGPIRIGEALPNVPDFIERYPKILNVRDPRDVLTSLFYSFVYSHPKRPVAGGFNPDDAERAQWERDGIDTFVIRNMEEYKNRYDILCKQILGNENLLMLKYEDMVLDYGGWLMKYLGMFKDIQLVKYRTYDLFGRKYNLKRIYTKLYSRFRNEFQVSGEDPKKHKRQLLPGDYRRKLEPGTIELLNREFQPILKVLGYE